MKHYVAALFYLEQIREGYDYSQSNIVHDFIYNMLMNQFVIFNKNTDQKIDLDPLAGEIFNELVKGEPVTWHAQKEGFSFKIVIKLRSQYQENNKVMLYPLAPIKFKIDPVTSQEELDLGFYIQRMIELTENFTIDEFEAK